jgi:hypothetical protein
MDGGAHFLQHPRRQHAGVARRVAGLGAVAGAAAAAVVVNLSPTDLQLSAAESAGFSTFTQVSAADATTPVNKASTLTRAAGAISGKLLLPAYSVTMMS